ncbi:MAG TPA: 3-ketoacyl-ACP reductase [Geminicoccaceae bacterium]
MTDANVSPAAFVTGAGRGIGRAIALALADAGFDVVVNDRERSAEAEATLEGIGARGRRSAFLGADVGDLDGQDRLLERAWDAFGRMDCVVNNAGVAAFARGDLLDVTVESYDHCQRVNARALFFMTQKAARRMLVEPDRGHPRTIVNVSSVNATVPSILRGDYCVSKAAASMATQLFAERLAPHGIQVFEVRPGIIRTDMTAPARAYYDEKLKAGLTPIPRWGEPEDIGRAVASAATGGLPFTVGQVLAIDGGLARRMF